MTKALLTKIIIGVFATGTVGTVGLVVASKNPLTSQAVKSVPAIAKYVDIVTFNKGLSDEELTKVLDVGKYLEIIILITQKKLKNYLQNLLTGIMRY